MGTFSKRHYDELKEWFRRNTQVKYVDETGWRIQGDRIQLIDSFNASVVSFQYSEKCKQPYMMRLFRDDPKQLIICDCALVDHVRENRQLCWAYVLRDF